MGHLVYTHIRTYICIYSKKKLKNSRVGTIFEIQPTKKKEDRKIETEEEE